MWFCVCVSWILFWLGALQGILQKKWDPEDNKTFRIQGRKGEEGNTRVEGWEFRSWDRRSTWIDSKVLCPVLPCLSSPPSFLRRAWDMNAKKIAIFLHFGNQLFVCVFLCVFLCLCVCMCVCLYVWGEEREGMEEESSDSLSNIICLFWNRIKED